MAALDMLTGSFISQQESTTILSHIAVIKGEQGEW